MQVNDSSSAQSFGNFGSKGIEDSGSPKAEAGQSAGVSKGIGGDDLLEVLKKLLMQAEQQSSQGQGGEGQGQQAGNAGQIQFG
ncbi:hypothetical protein JFU58_15800 [Pseudomonas sp. TH34]|jgi:hypothetical protein|uniref:hypothetical protein n=1 Tax=Pseudomonas TaxID=286 RepID=UPI001912C976|nr:MULTISPECIES: hypothetical protein [Pseudomonas]MBK5409997.1 hypothetical protein [Pseudomonas sp. TH34]MBV6665229.1 hypothetical protein [Pseudomonas yamanorum]